MLFVYEIVSLKKEKERKAPTICQKAGHTFTKVSHCPSLPGRTEVNQPREGTSGVYISTITAQPLSPISFPSPMETQLFLCLVISLKFMVPSLRHYIS